MEIVYHWIAQYGYAALFGGMMLGIVGLPVPDETLLTYAGYLVSNHTLLLHYTLLAAYLGSMSGISVSYELGRWFGYPLIEKYGRYLLITHDELERANEWYRRFGKWSLPVGYFIPGVRHFTAFVAGVSGLRYRTFGLFAYSGAVVWASTFVLLGKYVGSNWETAVTNVRSHIFTASLIAFLLGASLLLLRWFRK
ncbi:MAG TPA: DedA family protein [Bacteroidota bacterium]|nr:DedA family protein [Bacteroidota bacterium]